MNEIQFTMARNVMRRIDSLRGELTEIHRRVPVDITSLADGTRTFAARQMIVEIDLLDPQDASVIRHHYAHALDRALADALRELERL